MMSSEAKGVLPVLDAEVGLDHLGVGLDFLRRALGDHVFERLIEAQRIEWNAFRKHVSGWERDRYLEVY